MQDEVLAEEATTNMRFLGIDCGPLKQALVGHCEAWVQRFTGLLHQLASNELKSLHKYFSSNAEALAVPPSNLDQLAESVNLHRAIVGEKRKISQR